MEDIFTTIYENNRWGNDRNDRYTGSSGKGSEIAYNQTSYVPFLKGFISGNNIKTVVDLGCGTFKYGPLIYDELDIVYTGYDVYKKIVDYNSDKKLPPKYTFLYLDFYKDKESILHGDLCILKDVLQHWEMNEISAFLDFIIHGKKFKYILICNCHNQKTDNPENTKRYTPLSHNFLPLKKYNPKQIFRYDSKEVCVIEVDI